MIIQYFPEKMENRLRDGLRLRPKSNVLHIYRHLPRYALLGDEFQLDTFRIPQGMGVHHQREGRCIEGCVEVQQAERLPE